MNPPIATPESIASIGHIGSYSFAAAQWAAPKAVVKFFPAFADVCAAVTRGDCTLGVLPIENSLTGSIHENYDLLKQQKLHIVGEVCLNITHALLVTPGGCANDDERLRGVRTIFSHPQALLQCGVFLKKHPHLQTIALADTATAAARIARLRKSSEAAIAGKSTGELLGLRALKMNVADHPCNITRFVVIAKQKRIDKEADKASVILQLPHVPGSLSRVLRCFAERKLNLTKIESRPIIGTPWEYTFYVDVEIGRNIRNFMQSLEDIRLVAHKILILGLYKKGETI